MKQEISAFMDGELFEDEADNLLGRIKRDPAVHQDWEIYHLLGDVLRQPEYIPHGLSAQVHKRMQDEPTILAPRGRAVKQKVRAFALSAAASLLAIGVVVWMSLQISAEVSPQMAMQRTAPVPVQIQSQPNDYLMAHQEFSPSTDMNGSASYIRTVAYGANKNQKKNNTVEK